MRRHRTKELVPAAAAKNLRRSIGCNGNNRVGNTHALYGTAAADLSAYIMLKGKHQKRDLTYSAILDIAMEFMANCSCLATCTATLIHMRDVLA